MSDNVSHLYEAKDSNVEIDPKPRPSAKNTTGPAQQLSARKKPDVATAESSAPANPIPSFLLSAFIANHSLEVSLARSAQTMELS